MSLPTAVLLSCLGCYLIGSVPFGYIVGRARGIDIRAAGSGNIGATNVGRLLGRKWGIAVFLLDVLKGLGPTVGVGLWYHAAYSADALPPTLRNVVWLVAGICCVLGHNYPIYLGLRGGKGVATSLGVVLGVFPYLTLAGLLAFAVWLLVTLATRYVSAGSIAAALAFPVLLAGCMLWAGFPTFRRNWALLVFAFLLSGLVIYRHRANIGRLRAGTESRIGGR
jgi:glycerol-3-phosphate acyltransferase PlsY